MTSNVTLEVGSRVVSQGLCRLKEIRVFTWNIMESWHAVQTFSCWKDGTLSGAELPELPEAWGSGSRNGRLFKGAAKPAGFEMKFRRHLQGNMQAANISFLTPRMLGVVISKSENLPVFLQQFCIGNSYIKRPCVLSTLPCFFKPVSSLKNWQPL